MPLFTDPVALTDGTSNHSFTFRSQVPHKSSIIGEWIEPSAEISAESRIIVKHDTTSPTVKRRLLQRIVNLPILDGTLRPVTVNFTVTHHPEHALADVQKQVNIEIDALTEVSFLTNFLQGLI